MRSLLSTTLCHRTPRLFDPFQRSVQARAKSSIVTAWGAYVGQFTDPVDPASDSLEKHARTTPVQISLGKLFQYGTDDAADIAVDAIGAGVRHALVSTRSLSEGVYASHLAGFGLNRCQQLGQKGSHASVITRVPGRVTQIACGREHSAMIVAKKDRTKAVMVCGNNSYGQLGIGINDPPRLAVSKGAIGADQHEPQLQTSGLVEVTAMNDILRSGETPAKVQCGMDHTAILTSSGRVFAMGWGSDGQLGVGPSSTFSHDRPVQVFGLDDVPIVDIDSSTDFTLALSADGRLFYWGNSEYGQCMTGEKVDQVLAPIEMPFNGGTIVGIAAGGCHALVLSSDGRVHACGYGAIGMGAGTISSLSPATVHGISNVEYIAASTDRCIALDSQRHVYSWGFGNRAGRLGNGSISENIHTPVRLDIDPELVQPDLIALGNDIALLASNSGFCNPSKRK
ncbi:hypothetical protein LPJ81_001894 [Coemansia sp. IMI 209127]|nr:hypothetical protein LPJ81_001894 [Coemansia sp. IMI 209127]